jgi:hypothetical protein
MSPTDYSVCAGVAPVIQHHVDHAFHSSGFDSGKSFREIG